jgi:hypothetical protein
MKTQLEIVPQVTIPGEKIQVQRFEVSNVHLHQVTLTISRMMNAILEMDMSNSGSGVSQSEAKAIQADWTRVNAEWTRALKYRGLNPTGGIENTFNVLLLTQNQMLSMVNVRGQRTVQALRNLAERLVACDSAKQEFDIQATDEEAVNAHLVYCTEVLADYIGTINAGEFNRGLEIPAHTHLGTVVPPENMGEASSFEPSPEAHENIPVPDVVDVASKVPPQG